jgi:DNA-binding beta-propeller fold protein YncE
MFRLIIAALLAPVALAGAGSARVAATITIGPQACGILAFGKYLYADSYGRGTLARIDPSTNTVVARVARVGTPCGLAGGANAIWIEDYQGNAVVRVGVKHLRITNRIRVGHHPWDVAFGFGSVWASNESDGTVSRIDPGRRKVVKTIATGGAPACLRVADGAVWVGGQNGDIFRIDPATNVSQTIRVGHASELCVDPNADGVWVVENLDDSVTVLDPGTYAPLRTIALPARPTDAFRGPDGYEWVASRVAGTVTRIDPASGTIVDSIATGGNPFVIRAGFGDVWTADFGGSSLWRLHVAP